MRYDVAERNLELWMLAVSPGTWALHFMACYLTASIWCAKVGRSAETQTSLLRMIAAYTAIALPLIAVVAVRGWRRHRLGATTPAAPPGPAEPRLAEAAPAPPPAPAAPRLDSSKPPHDDDTPEDRHRFLGWATFLLSILSAIAVCYSALAAVFLRSCT
jgi:hypothetical protein